MLGQSEQPAEGSEEATEPELCGDGRPPGTVRQDRLPKGRPARFAVEGPVY